MKKKDMTPEERAKMLEEALIQVIVRISGRQGWGEDGLRGACKDVERICQEAINKF